MFLKKIRGVSTIIFSILSVFFFSACNDNDTSEPLTTEVMSEAVSTTEAQTECATLGKIPLTSCEETQNTETTEDETTLPETESTVIEAAAAETTAGIVIDPTSTTTTESVSVAETIMTTAAETMAQTTEITTVETTQTSSRLVAEAPLENTYYTIENATSMYAIEADVTLNGSGTGYHAKLVICTPTSAISFGIQFDEYASAPYTGKAMAMVENVYTNNSGEQAYSRPGNNELELGQTVHMMVTLNYDGSGAVYLDHYKIGTFYNAGLANQPGNNVYLRVEASGRKNGDYVQASFNNIKLKGASGYNVEGAWWTTVDFTSNEQQGSIVNEISDIENIYFHGSIAGLSSDADWDSAYNSVSGIIQFEYHEP